jgi:hypothetical protein
MGGFRTIVDWQSARELLLPHLADKERHRLAASLDVFEAIVGPDWDGWRSSFPLSHLFWWAPRAGQVHPGVKLAYSVVGAACADTEEATRRATALGEADASNFLGAQFEFLVWRVLARAGLRPRFVPETRGRRQPDLLVQPHKRAVALELKTLQTPSEERDLYRVVARKMDLEAALEQHGTLDLEFAPALASAVRHRFDEIESAARTLVTLGQPHAVIEGLCTIRFSSAPRASGSAISSAPRTDIATKPERTRDVRALRRIIKDNHDKLAGHGPAVYVVSAHEHLSLDWRGLPRAAEHTAGAIAEVLSQVPAASGVLLVEPGLTWEQLDPWQDSSSGWFAWSVPDRHGEFHAGMFVLNPRAASPLTDEEVRRLILIGAAPV